MLGPHHREDPELGQRRLAAEGADDALVFVGLQPVALEDVRRRLALMIVQWRRCAGELR